MTDAEILLMAARHNIIDKFDIQPRAEEVIGFARDLAGALMAERDAPPPLSPPGLDWREKPRFVVGLLRLPADQPVEIASGANPMSDSDLAPL